MKDPEFKKMMGYRKQNSDGFTYVYGAVKDGSPVNHSSNRVGVKSQIRNDNRSVKGKVLRRILKEE